MIQKINNTVFTAFMEFKHTEKNEIDPVHHGLDPDRTKKVRIRNTALYPLFPLSLWLS
jgi:hypothetical protein